ncbi:hypothetical protein, partial [Candidatus Cyrtobacter comes]|uniref:hypothetical protein n=1 Tax=Candidatus Cyrtobacter comes TaxID=675776 RepID=UPI002ACD5404
KLSMLLFGSYPTLENSLLFLLNLLVDIFVFFVKLHYNTDYNLTAFTVVTSLFHDALAICYC